MLKWIKSFLNRLYRGRNIFEEYLQKSSIHGYSLIVNKQNTKADRYLWIVTSLTIISAASWLVADIYFSFEYSPTVTTQSPLRSHISQVPFPAIAVCSGNRVHRASLIKLAEKVFKFQQNSTTKIGKTIDEVAESLKFIGSLLTMTYDEEEFYEIDKVHTLLLEYFNGPYKTDYLLAYFAIDCSELLLRCRLQDKTIDCNKIFRLQKAWIGMCCMFNYNRPGLVLNATHVYPSEEFEENTNHPPLLAVGSGISNGLTVVINDTFDKFTYKIYSSVSSKLAIFSPENSPEAPSVGFSESQAIMGREILIGMKPEIISGDSTMRRYHPRVRKCFFRDETGLSLHRFYSISECLIVCQIKDVLNFCGCIPPNFTNRNNASYCLLSDIACLARWLEKWQAYEPLNLVDSNVGQFAHCPQCLPLCNYIDYKITTSWSVLKKPMGMKKYTYGIMENLSRTDHTVIYFYFAHNFVDTMEQSIMYNWTEVLALLGGVCGLMYGASILSLAEFLYFLTGKFFTMPKSANSTDRLIATNKSLPEIYWSELNVYHKRRTVDID